MVGLDGRNGRMWCAGEGRLPRASLGRAGPARAAAWLAGAATGGAGAGAMAGGGCGWRAGMSDRLPPGHLPGFSSAPGVFSHSD